MNTLEYWEKQPIDKPWTLNGFAGTWAFTDHDLISNDLRNFIMESFHPEEKFKRIPLEDINKLMNDVWEGPGSMVKLQKLTVEMFAARQTKKTENSTKMIDAVRTIDDYDENEFSVKKVVDED